MNLGDNHDKINKVDDYAFSVIIPIFKNQESINDLFRELESAFADVVSELEIIFVIDGSPDESEIMIRKLSQSSILDIKLIAHSRNFGSFAAIRTGLISAKGKLVGVMSADLQEDPRTLINLFKELSTKNADVAFGVRAQRNDPLISTLSSNLYWSAYRRFINSEIPKGGVDIFVCRNSVAAQINSMKEVNSSLVGLLFWVGFKRVFVEYDRNPRKYGRSAWTIKKKFKYMADSIFSFSDLPIKLVRILGLTGFFFSILFGGFLILASLAGKISVPGYAPLMLAIILGNSSILIALSLLGSYLWRIYENSQMRPVSILTTREETGEK
jgi:glycosyltransferase involved in cell wall biosynthesis